MCQPPDPGRGGATPQMVRQRNLGNDGAGFAIVAGVSADDDKEVLIPEVLPPENGRARGGGFRPPEPPPRPGRRPSALDRTASVLGPIFSGLLLDYVAATTFGRPAFFACLLLGFWFARVCGLRLKHSFLAALLAGSYGALMLPKLVPAATCLGLFFTLRNAEIWKKR